MRELSGDEVRNVSGGHGSNYGGRGIGSLVHSLLSRYGIGGRGKDCGNDGGEMDGGNEGGGENDGHCGRDNEPPVV